MKVREYIEFVFNLIFSDKDVKSILFLVLSFILTSYTNNYSQNNNPIFEQIFLQHGLSQSIVTHIIQDKTGFIWIATEDGLNKFDGYEFKVYRNDPNNTNSPSYNQITALYGDTDGRIWIGTFYGGLDLYDPLKNKFTHHRFDPKNEATLSNNNVNVIYEDKEGYLWIGTDAGLNKFDKTTRKFTRFQNNPKNDKSLSHNIIRSICEDKEGNLWIGTDNGLNRFDRKNDSFTVFLNEPGNSKSISHNEIYSIYCDRSGILWIGTRGGGLNKLIPPTKNNSLSSFIRYKNVPGNPGSINNDQVYAIYEDTNGTLWIGTNGGGLNIFDRKTESFRHYLHNPLNPASLSYNEVRSIFEDRSGLIWIGTYGGGIDLVNRGRKKFNLYSKIPNTPNSLNENIVWSIYEDNSGIIWIGTHGGGLNSLDRSKKLYTHYLHDPNNTNSLSHNIVRLVFEDKESNFWVGTNGGGLNLFYKATGNFKSFTHRENDTYSISYNELRSIYQDRSGTIWIGTNGGGLNKMIFDNNKKSSPKFITYRNSPDDQNSLSNDFVRVIFEDHNGNFWIGTQGGGLNKFDREKNIFTHYRAKSGDIKSINNDYIFAIYEDSHNRLWLGTWGGGLIEFDVLNKTFRSYTIKNGLPSDAIYGMLEDEDGFLWISTNNGLAKFDPDKKTFKNFNVSDGLQNNEFNGGSFFKSKNGEMFFGGIGGFNSFYPKEIKDNTHIPPVVITSFKKLNREVTFERPINTINEIELSNEDYLFSFEFASLDFNSPPKNMYAYKMEGLDENWITTTADKRYAVYTTLSPGKYVFHVKGSNNDGIWNETGTSINIIILPPFWKTWWFIAICLMLTGGLFVFSLKRRMKNVRILTELRTAHETQMSIMPNKDPEIELFDFSALCIPASEVGGDFFDYIWMDEEKTKLGIIIGDVSGKGMKSAMNALLCSGMITSLIHGNLTVKEIMTRVNRSLFSKTDRKMFTALCFSMLDIRTKELIFTNAGLNPPLVKTNGKVFSLESSGPKFPLGGLPTTEYKEQKHQFTSGDILLFSTDGITEAQNKEKELYGAGRLITLLELMDTHSLSAQQIKEAIFENVTQFTFHTNQSDDMTLIIIKVL
ncbi:MAG: SpoIIE family protein phosphatase [Ignavibacteriales bacterium]|nr:SpoIIE family protein phosphatase [Ignavibacteriales bacterium]